MDDIFERVEYKYVLTTSQYKAILETINKHFKVDCYGKCTIQSLYYDTDDYRLVRNSIEKPLYKEKLRLRSYGLANDSSKVYLEIKKKYKGIVYKRRVKIKENEANDILLNKVDENQIEKEIAYFSSLYGNLEPKVLILYDRTALVGLDNEIRLTFDENARYRDYDLNLHTSLNGKNIFDENQIIMEVKTTNSLPLWFCKLLNDNKIYKSSFSKYGTVYTKNNYFMNRGTL